MTGFPHIDLTDRTEPLVIAWPMPGNPAEFLRFHKASEWRSFVESLGIDNKIPEIVRSKFLRAQKLFMLGWVDIDCIKASELGALIALELALMDRYGGQLSRRKRRFATLLKHMLEVDGLTDAQIPMVARCGGTAVRQLSGQVSPTLAEWRNTLAHGDPFDGAPVGGLLELVRDLINYAHRSYITEAAQLCRNR